VSVRVYSDTGPSYTVHEPSPGSGPAICSRCVHVRKGGLSDPQFCKAWACGAVPGEVIRKAGVDPITGAAVPELIRRPMCTDRNARGDCQNFDVAPAPGFRPDGDGTDRPGKIGRGDPRMEAGEKVDAGAAMLSSLACFIVGACLGGVVVAAML
jgi:hypothetical protein